MRFPLFVTALALLVTIEATAQVGRSGLAIREVAVFKDGHAFVDRQGEVELTAGGEVVLDDLPQPLLGTFFPYARGGATATAVTAARRRVAVHRTALSLRDIVAANIGADVYITEIDQKRYAAKIKGMIDRSAAELDRNDPAGGDLHLPEMGTLAVLETADGQKVVDVARFVDVTFRGERKSTLEYEEIRNRLTIKVGGVEARQGSKAVVGFIYVEKGMRWIPNYKVVIDGAGEAKLALHATIVNDLGDLEGAVVDLVIGVPSFVAAGQMDPIALRDAVAQVARQYAYQSQSVNVFDNNLLNNFVGSNPAGVDPSAGRADAGPEFAGGSKHEDLFVFTLKNVNLKKGERLSVPVATFDLKYDDIYTVTMPIMPPRNICAQVSSMPENQLRGLMAPKVDHKLRFTNSSGAPLTTAPVLVFQKDQLLGQGLFTYTARGGSVDVTMGKAVDIRVKKKDVESKRQPGAVVVDRESYTQITLDGSITITNYAAKTTKLEIKRYLFGAIDRADADGKIAMVSLYDEELAVDDVDPDSGWGRFSWPSWWNQLNGVGTITWNLALEPGKDVTLAYGWHYYWR